MWVPDLDTQVNYVSQSDLFETSPFGHISGEFAEVMLPGGIWRISVLLKGLGAQQFSATLEPYLSKTDGAASKSAGF